MPPSPEGAGRASGGPVKLAPVPAPLPFDPIQEAGRQWRARWGRRPVAPMEAVTSIMRVQQILLARCNQALEPFGLTFARYEALMLLSFTREGALPLGKIGARLQVHPASVTNLIDGLEQQSYARREPHPTDRRTTLAVITDKGRGQAEAATEAMHAVRFGIAGLGTRELEELTALLRHVRVAEGDFEDD
jgi:DNA-binding MarR family transcriptional regulator